MRFTWDPKKLHTNIRKHGIHFQDASEVFDAPMLCNLDDRFDYGEDRWVGIGIVRGRCIVVVYTEETDDVIRLISARKAQKHEREEFQKSIQDRLDTD